jgi:cytochrome o ubiquinol oxidase subunit 1
MIIADVLGRLNFHALPQDAVTAGGALSMVAALIGIAVLLTYTKRWKWLYKEWLTTTDPKKIGVMYISVALIMLLRGLADAGMMRAQQALSAGSHHGCPNCSSVLVWGWITGFGLCRLPA